MNDSCNGTLYKTALFVDSATNGASVLVCLLAAALVFVSKLYRKTIYRLALYQVLAGEFLASIHVTQIVIINYYRDEEVYNDVCKAFACLTLFAEWTKLVLTMWMTLHLFSFAGCHRNLRRCEAVYLSTSLLVPAVVAGIPFATKSYGLAGSWCWIKSTDNCFQVQLPGLIEQFALWYGPSMVLLLGAAVAMFLTIALLARRLYQRMRTLNLHTTNQNQHRNALKQLLPFAIYPIFYFAFNIPPFVYRAYRASGRYNDTTHGLLLILTAASTSAWCLAAGITLIIHLLMTKPFRLCKEGTYVKVNVWMK